MSEAMTSITAIKTYFNTDTNRPLENKELIELKKALNAEQWAEFGQMCCKALGVEWKVA